MPLLTLFLAAGAAATPTIPQMRATMYQTCLSKAAEGAPPEMRHLIPQVCTCFVSRVSAGRTPKQVHDAMDQNQDALGRQCIGEAAQADAAKHR